MKINDKDLLSSSLQNLAKTGATNTSARSTASNAIGQSSPDAVNLSSHNKFLSSASAAGESERAARIAQLKALYVSGQYHVDSQQVGSAIIDAHIAGS